MDNSKIMFDPQYLDNNYQRYYFVPWPDCQVFDELGDEDTVIPVSIQDIVGSFVNAEWAASIYETR